MPIGINPVRPDPFERRDPRSQDERNMDKIFKALSIANAGMGIGVNFQKFQEIRENRALAPAKEAREARAAEDTSASVRAGTAGQEAITAHQKQQTANLPTQQQASRQTEADIAKTKQEAANKVAELRQKGVDNVAKLRKEWQTNPITKNTAQAKVAFDKADAMATGEARALKDRAAVVAYYQTLEPGLQVKADERAAVEASRSLDSRFTGALQKVLEGKILDDSVRADLQKTVSELYKQQQGQQIQYDNETRRLAEEFGFKPDQAVLDMGFYDRTDLDQAGSERAAGAGGIPLAPEGGATVTNQLLKGRAPAAAPAAAPPEFSPEEIKAVMDGAQVDQAEAIRRLKAVSGGQ